MTVSPSSHINYFFFEKKNLFLFPFTFVLFVIFGLMETFYFRFLSQYDDVVAGKSEFFENTQIYWRFMGLFLPAYFLIVTLANFLLSIIVLNSNNSIHETMVLKLVRSPLSYFDKVSSSHLTNKFSNDLNSLDTVLPFSLSLIMERIILSAILLLNVVQINLILVFPIIICLIFLVKLYFKMKKLLLKTQELNLINKNPIFKYMK